MPYVLGLVGGIAFGLLLAALIVIRICDGRNLKGNKELAYTRDSIDDIIKKMSEISDRYYLSENKEGDPFPDRLADDIIDDLYVIKKRLNHYIF